MYSIPNNPVVHEFFGFKEFEMSTFKTSSVKCQSSAFVYFLKARQYGCSIAIQLNITFWAVRVFSDDRGCCCGDQVLALSYC